MNKIYSILETKHKKKLILLLFFMSVSTILEVVGIGSIIPAVSIILNDTDAFLFDLEIKEKA